MADQHLYQNAPAPQKASEGKFRVVMRLGCMEPRHVKGLVAHGERTLGNMDHIVGAKNDMRFVMVGDNDIAKQILKQSKEMSEFNRDSRLAARKFKTSKALKEARANIPLDPPWRQNAKSKGPLREGILSVHRDFFVAGENTKTEDRITYLDDKGEMTTHDKQKYREFVKVSKEYLKEAFGEHLVYARFDGDEQSGHVHFLVVKTADEPASKRYPHGRRVFKINGHRLVGLARKDENGKTIKGYEALQDHVGEFFETKYPEMNIIRGRQGAKEKREAMAEADKILAEAKAAGQQIPEGSKEGQRIFAIKKKIENAKQAGGLRGDAKQELVIELMGHLGELTAEQVENQPKGRKARKELLAPFENDYGSVDEIIANPKEVIRKHAEKAKREVDAYARKKSVENMEDSFDNAVSAVSVDADKEKLQQREADLVAREQDVQKKLEAAEERALKAERAQRVAEDEMNAAEAMMQKAQNAMRQMKVLKKIISDKVPEFFRKKVEQAFDKIGIEPAQFSNEPTVPGTFLVEATEQPSALRERLNGMNNAALRKGAAITSDAVNILDEPDEKMERAQARLGLKVLENEALNRGFDLKSGMHDPEKAKLQTLAYLHTDQPGEPILEQEVVKKRVSSRSR